MPQVLRQIQHGTFLTNAVGIEISEEYAALSRARIEESAPLFLRTVGHVQHLGEVQDVRVKMDTVHAIGDVARKVRQIGIADIFLNRNILERKPGNLTVDPL